MRKKNKRILSLLLVLICLTGVLAVPAFASELYDKQVTASSSGDEGTEQAEGSVEEPAESTETLAPAEEPEETKEAPEAEAVSESEKAKDETKDEPKEESKDEKRLPKTRANPQRIFLRRMKKKLPVPNRSRRPWMR